MSNDNKNIISPSLKKLLDQYDPKAGMTVPEGYFENLPEFVLSRVNDEDVSVRKPSIKVLFLNSAFWKATVAASIIIMMSVATLNIVNNSGSDEFLAGVPEEHGWEYILDMSDEYGIDDFAELPEMEDAISTLESELYGINITEEFIEDVDFEIVEDLFK